MDCRNSIGGSNDSDFKIKVIKKRSLDLERIMKQKDTNTKKLVILGAGESGVGTALLGKAKGYEVFVSDFGEIKQQYALQLEEAEISFESGKHTEEEILSATVVVKSPGIPDKAVIVQKLLGQGVPVISEIEFAAEYTDATIVGITGSNGKTTTTLLTGHLLQSEIEKVGVAGNIGDSFAKSILEQECSHYVLELSSFQLDGIKSFAPHIAVLLNITPDHLDRYEYKFENYVASKFRITMNQSEEDYFIYDADDKTITTYLENNNTNAQGIPFSITRELERGVCLRKGTIIMKLNDNEEELGNISDISISGKHNTKNAMAAATIAKLVGIRKQTIRESLSTFKNASHRLEDVLKIKNVNYINDSKATNVNATYYALEAVKKPIVWIVGGVDKGNDYSELLGLVNEKVKAVICLGVDNSKIIEAFQGSVEEIRESQSMKDAVRMAYNISEKGDVVLLSPCCASFDLFKSYEDRGDQFKEAVRNL